MKTSEEIKTIAQTIVWLAKERMKTEEYQNINSVIHAVSLELHLELMQYMKNEK